MTQPGRREVKRGLTVGERAHHTGATPDLTQDTLERIVNRYEKCGADVLPLSFAWLQRMVRPSGTVWEHEGAGRPICTMSCELVLLAGRLCDLPGCAESANP